MSLLLRLTCACAIPALAIAQPTIRVTTRLIDVTVVARDARGAVPDLVQSDFTVLDNGVERPVSFFSVNSTRPAPPALLPPNTFTNRPSDRPDAPGRVTVFLIDGLSTEVEAQARIRQQFQQYASRIGPRDRAAVWVMNTSLHPLQDFTNDPARLIASVENYRPRPNPFLPIISPSAAQRSPGNDGAAMAQSLENRGTDMVRSYGVQLTSDLLRDLAAALARIPGRKNLVWLSSGFPVSLTMGRPGPSSAANAAELTGTGRALAKADISVYPVDARGLVAPSSGGAAMATSIAEQQRHRSMDLLAAETGGRAFYDRNDLSTAIAEAVDDSEITYTLGFYPSSQDDDERPHHVEIRVRRPDVQLRYRSDYLAAASRLLQPEDERRDEIRNALWSPLEAVGVVLSARLEPRSPKLPDWTNLSIAIALSNLTPDPDRSGRFGPFDLVIGQRAADGRELATVSDVLSIDTNTKSAEWAVVDARLVLKRRVHREKAADRIRVVVCDRASGRIGSLDLPAQPR